MVKFLNNVPWGGLYFCYTPGQVIDLEEDIAKAREEAGLGKIVTDKSKKPAVVQVEAVAPDAPPPATPEVKADPKADDKA